jgi:pyridoxine 5-phosphate synthase
MAEKALAVRPDDACIVPERRQEVTTEGGLDVASQRAPLQALVRRLRDGGIHVSLFIDPDPRQIEAAADVGAELVELHTGAYANAAEGSPRDAEAARVESGAAKGRALGLRVNAGHGLTLDNVSRIAAIAEIEVLNIGHSIVARAILVGMEAAVREMRQLLDQVRAGS